MGDFHYTSVGPEVSTHITDVILKHNNIEVTFGYTQREVEGNWGFVRPCLKTLKTELGSWPGWSSVCHASKHGDLSANPSVHIRYGRKESRYSGMWV